MGLCSSLSPGREAGTRPLPGLYWVQVFTGSSGQATTHEDSSLSPHFPSAYDVLGAGDINRNNF